jgi:hypothetical protein
MGSLLHAVVPARLLLVGRPSVISNTAFRVNARVESLIAFVICVLATFRPSIVFVLPLLKTRLVTAVFMELMELPRALSAEQSPFVLESPVGVDPPQPRYAKLVIPI